MEVMPDLAIKDLHKSYGVHTVFDGFNTNFKGGTVTAVLGVSGSGKSTLLNCIAGLVGFEGGIQAHGDISYIFQNERLIKNLTAAQNIEYVLRGKIRKRAEREETAMQYLKHVRLEDYADKYPHELSGGMRQRVSMARAFCYPSQILLMDEPFKSLDIALKIQLLNVFNQLYHTAPRTTVFVTHDIDEALLVSERIILLGGQPADVIYDAPVPGAPDKRRQMLLSGAYSDINAELYSLLGL